MPAKPATVDEYIAMFPDDIQHRLQLIRDTIKQVAPDCEETIRYGMPAYKLLKQHIYFSGYKKHIGMYPMYGIPALEPDLKPYRSKKAKDAIHFYHTNDIPVALIKKIVKAKQR